MIDLNGLVVTEGQTSVITLSCYVVAKLPARLLADYISDKSVNLLLYYCGQMPVTASTYIAIKTNQIVNVIVVGYPRKVANHLREGAVYNQLVM